MKTAHKFQQDEAGGNTFERSWSHQRCKNCGRAFTHYYNTESYWDAMEKAGVPLDCSTQ